VNLGKGFKSRKTFIFAGCFRVFRFPATLFLYVERTQKSLVKSGFFVMGKSELLAIPRKI